MQTWVFLILARVYRSRNEWDAESGQTIFRATMSLQKVHILSLVICFDNRDTRPGSNHRSVGQMGGVSANHLYPSLNVTVDEHLVIFRGYCPFKQYRPSKSSKSSIKIWAPCVSRASYAWKMQVYSGKPTDGVTEKNPGKHVILEMILVILWFSLVVH